MVPGFLPPAYIITARRSANESHSDRRERADRANKSGFASGQWSAVPSLTVAPEGWCGGGIPSHWIWSEIRATPAIPFAFDGQCERFIEFRMPPVGW
jgi:hypothetical protein